MLQIKKMEISLKTRRPAKKGRNIHTEEKGLTEFQLELLFELFRPGSALNPFKDQFVRSRNRLIFLLLYHLGLRGGELLNIRIRDIDFTKNQLVIARRADEKDDSRKYQPLVKTLDRRLPIKETLVKELHYYIIKERKKIPSSNKNDFLFITHKSGPTQGQPLSKSGYKKVIEMIRNTSPSLFNLTGHQLRHTWQLSKNHKVYVGAVINLLDASITESYIKTLLHYSVNYSASHTSNINDRVMHFLRTTNSSNITVNGLINYRSQLTTNTEWYLGVIRGFLIKWHELDYPGISNEIIELFDGWVIKGNIKGDVIKRR